MARPHLAGRGHGVKWWLATAEGAASHGVITTSYHGHAINLLNLQGHLREANSTSPENTLVWWCMAATLSPPRLLPSGDSAITVEFSRNIDDAANQRVLALDRNLAAEPVSGVTETIPADYLELRVEDQFGVLQVISKDGTPCEAATMKPE